MNVCEGNENDNADVARFLKNLKQIAEECDCHVLAIHHTGHANKGRAIGGIRWVTQPDTSFLIYKSENRPNVRFIESLKARTSNKNDLKISVSYDLVELDEIDGDETAKRRSKSRTASMKQRSSISRRTDSRCSVRKTYGPECATFSHRRAKVRLRSLPKSRS